MRCNFAGVALDSRSSAWMAVALCTALATGAVMRAQPQSDLTVAVSAAPDPVRPGEVVQYAVTVTNRFATSEWITVYAQVPNHATVASSAISGTGRCGMSTCGPGMTIEWSFSAVGAGQSVTVLYAARIDTVAPPAEGMVLRSTVTAMASGEGASAPAAVDVVVAGATDLSMGMTQTPASVASGSTLSYVLRFGNPTATSAPAGVLSALVPAGTTFVSASAGGTLTGDGVQWNVEALAPGASGQRQFAVAVDDGLPERSVITAVADLRAGSVRVH